jgi:hypothetical protein
MRYHDRGVRIDVGQRTAGAYIAELIHSENWARDWVHGLMFTAPFRVVLVVLQKTGRSGPCVDDGIGVRGRSTTLR